MTKLNIQATGRTDPNPGAERVKRGREAKLNNRMNQQIPGTKLNSATQSSRQTKLNSVALNVSELNNATQARRRTKLTKKMKTKMNKVVEQ